MGRFGIAEDQPIESRLVSKSIEGAQEKIEGFHFDARKHVLEYDDVLNFQRKLIYSRRRTILTGTPDEVELVLSELLAGNDELEQIVSKKRQELEEQFLPSLRQLLLQIIDMLWLEHLEAMDYLRSSVRLRAYGQRDPLVEYKREGLSMFKEMEASLAANITRMLPNVGGIKLTTEQKNLQEVRIGTDQILANTQSLKFKAQTVGRNDPCPCGSGLKYKRCGLINAKEHRTWYYIEYER